jgi:sulfide dehydrogenase cytochrome subunit
MGLLADNGPQPSSSTAPARSRQILPIFAGGTADHYNHSGYFPRQATGTRISGMIKTCTLLAGLAVATLLCGDAWAQKVERKTKIVEQGEMLAQSCMACHGTRGASNQQAIPTIGGQIESYLNLSLKAYRDGTRPSTVMERIAKAYSTKEIEALAIYFSIQPFVRPLQNTDPDKVALGQSVHKRKCHRCHLHDGWDTSEDDSPLLAGQKLDYLRRNMVEILAGRRIVELNMNSALLKSTPEEIDAVLHFYASQHGDLH